MIVYVATGEDYEGASVYGVYSTPQLAEEALLKAVEEEKQNKHSPYTSYSWYKYYPVKLDDIAKPTWSVNGEEDYVLVLDTRKYNDEMLDKEIEKEYDIPVGEFTDL